MAGYNATSVMYSHIQCTSRYFDRVLRALHNEVTSLIPCRQTPVVNANKDMTYHNRSKIYLPTRLDRFSKFHTYIGEAKITTLM